MSSVLHFAAQLLLISCHGGGKQIVFFFTELGNIIVQTPCFWVHEKLVKFTMSNFDGCANYMHIGCLNCPECEQTRPWNFKLPSQTVVHILGNVQHCGASVSEHAVSWQVNASLRFVILFRLL